jgi:hypothetical protein
MLEHTKALVKSGAFLFSVSFNVLTVYDGTFKADTQSRGQKRKDILIVLTGPV